MTHHSSLAPSRKIDADLNLAPADELSQHTQDIFDLIARRAFEIFEGRGCAHGNDREDWFLAESELLKPVRVHISQSGGQVTASAEVPRIQQAGDQGQHRASSVDHQWENRVPGRPRGWKTTPFPKA